MGTRKERPLRTSASVSNHHPSQDRAGDVRELAVERGDDLADGLGSTSGGGDDVVADGSATTPVLVGGTVNGLLGGGGRVDGGHEALNDTELVVDDLGEGSKAVGRAGSVGNLSRKWR